MPVASQESWQAWVWVAATATSSAAFLVASSVCASLCRCWRGLAVRAFWSRRLGGDASGTGNESSGEGAVVLVAVRSVSRKLEHVLKDFTDRHRNVDGGVVGMPKQLHLQLHGVRQQVEGLCELGESVLVLQAHIFDWRGTQEFSLFSLSGAMEEVLHPT